MSTVGDELIKLAGPAAEGFEAVFPYDPNRVDPAWQEFKARFESRFHEKPDHFAALAYDAMQGPDPDDPVSQMISLGIRARILTDQGSVDEAEARGRRATEIGAGTDFLNHRADAHTDLAHVLFVAGRIDEAISELETALRLLEQKGNVLAAERTEELLARYRDGSNA